MAHDATEGLSSDGWLPDRISVEVLTRALTGAAFGRYGTGEQTDS